jgi:putative ABC transport system permease protein
MINLAEPFKIATQSLLSNRLRSMLTTMGVIIGVAAVITLVSMGEGAKSYILNQVRGWGMGANSLTIHPGKSETSMPELTLTYEDAVAIKEKIKHVVYIMPETVGKGRLKYGKKEYTPQYTLGISEDYPNALNQKVAEGRFFSKAEVDARRHVAVIGKSVARKLYGELTPIGETVKINNIGFQVIGVLEEKGSLLTTDLDDIALIPITVSESVIGSKKIWEVFLTVENEEAVPQAIKDITQLLIKRHKKEDFHIHTQQGMIDIINNILNALTGIVSAIAAISLLVGGIGIMNIMLVAVTERTREIGIRKSIGAKRSDIFLQFVFESVLITVSGALIGILIGTLAAWGIMVYLKLEAVIAWNAAMIACIVAFLVGTFFGVYPAMRAARLDPVEALRCEV